MAVTPEDVLHIAALARVTVAEDKLARLVRELNGILAHMEELSGVDTTRVEPMTGLSAHGTRLRPDTGPPVPLASPPVAFAPAMREGFFVVPRLATHADAEDRSR